MENRVIPGKDAVTESGTSRPDALPADVSQDLSDRGDSLPGDRASHRYANLVPQPRRDDVYSSKWKRDYLFEKRAPGGAAQRKAPNESDPRNRRSPDANQSCGEMESVGIPPRVDEDDSCLDRCRGWKYIPVRSFPRDLTGLSSVGLACLITEREFTMASTAADRLHEASLTSSAFVA